MSVELLDVMGDDLAVVDAARASLDKESEWDYTCTGYTLEASFAPGDDQYRPVYQKCLQDKDRRLINFLARNGHWSPFGQTAAKFRLHMPIFVARQWFKHSAGILNNEASRRYISDEPVFYMPTWRSAPEKSIKQGSGSELSVEDQRFWDFKAQSIYEDCRNLYNQMIEEGVAPEQARAILPQAMMTTVIETGNVASFARIYNLRNDDHAQQETREYALSISEEMKKYFPVSWEALTKHEDQ